MVIINKIILASKSPRRREILQKFTQDFEIKQVYSDESFDEKFDLITNIMSVSRNKGKKLSEDFPNKVIISADTIVVYNNEILHKPKNEKEARNYLKLLSNKTHKVITAFSIISLEDEISVSDYVTTEVKFHYLTNEIIDEYIKTLEWKDKAGGYGIQGYGSILIDYIYGDFYCVVGLPISKLSLYLKNYFEINLLRG